MKRLHIVCGPTASGKTAFAIRLARELDTEIISADSRQVFRELPVGSAAPTAAEQALVKHHLVGHLSVAMPYDAVQFAADAEALCKRLFSERDDVVLCGGSGLYIQALLFGFDDIPSVPPGIRAAAEKIYAEGGLQALHTELEQRDPAFMQGSETANPRRCLRALEVCLYTGQPYSAFRNGTRQPRYACELYYPRISREELYDRINRRVTAMAEAGLEEEARNVLPWRNAIALQTVGYKEYFAYFDGKYDLETCLAQIRKNTRNYAKRQETWFRNQLLERTAPEHIHYF